jgi:hypothetical protein
MRCRAVPFKADGLSFAKGGELMDMDCTDGEVRAAIEQDFWS